MSIWDDILAWIFAVVVAAVFYTLIDLMTDSGNIWIKSIGWIVFIVVIAFCAIKVDL